MDELLKLVEAYGAALAYAAGAADWGDESAEREAKERAAKTLDEIRAGYRRGAAGVALGALREAADEAASQGFTGNAMWLREYASIIATDMDVREIVRGGAR